VTPADTLLDAIRKMGVRGAPSIPVVDPRTSRLLGLVSRAHILALYERTVAGASSGAHPAFTQRAPTA
jgi:methylthioribose-1-phosphate isomerase